MELVEPEVAYHLGKLSQDFRSGRIHEDDVSNADETQFQIDLNDGRTLEMRGDHNIRFADVVSGDQGMTMMLLIGGGSRAEFGITMIIFKNDGCYYQIRGTPDNVLGV